MSSSSAFPNSSLSPSSSPLPSGSEPPISLSAVSSSSPATALPVAPLDLPPSRPSPSRPTRPRSVSLPPSFPASDLEPVDNDTAPSTMGQGDTLPRLVDALIDTVPNIFVSSRYPRSSAYGPLQRIPGSTLGPWDALPRMHRAIKKWKILLVATSMNSFTQKVWSYLHYLGITNISVQFATSDKDIVAACERWNPHIVLCPFLTTRVPEAVFKRWMTLIVHPGPPGDAGPSSLDWLLSGDNGKIANEEAAHRALMLEPTDLKTIGRDWWGCIVFQANEVLDRGVVWAWDQYPTPQSSLSTKAHLYQSKHSIAAIGCVIEALCRVHEQLCESPSPSLKPKDQSTWTYVQPRSEWGRYCLSRTMPFMGGPTLERGLLRPSRRRPDWDIHCAWDVLRIINAGDSQPGAQLPPFTDNATTALFAYGAHVHEKATNIPDIWTRLGYEDYQSIPPGTVCAKRDGAVFIKTKLCPDHQHQENLQPNCGVGIWITHGRVPKKADKPLEPKVPMFDAIMQTGHSHILDRVPEWHQKGWKAERGVWTQVHIDTVRFHDGIAQKIYWDFYNGAFSTANCKLLLSAIRWAVEADHKGKVKVLALMGGSSYFSNGIALNTIEASADPAKETWANINAIDDIVEYIIGCVNPLRSRWMDDVVPLPMRNIATVACIRGNAAAGGVALAAACDIVMMSRGAILNPAYRAMGLHGSEFHSFSYAMRCGKETAAKLLTDMLPLNSAQAYKNHLVDMEIGEYDMDPFELDRLAGGVIWKMLSSTSLALTMPRGEPGLPSFRCAPWSEHNEQWQVLQLHPAQNMSLAEFMSRNKTAFLQNYPHPLLDHRNEELSGMLLDCFHPVRSWRYVKRRYDFIRKVKATSTPSRYIKHCAVEPDPEGLASFDDAPGWERGTEWSYVDKLIPMNYWAAEPTRIELYPDTQTPKDQGRGRKWWNTIRVKGKESDASSNGSSGNDGEDIITPSSTSKFHTTVQSMWRALSHPGSFKSLSPSPPAPSNTLTPAAGGATDEGVGTVVRGADCEFACLYQPDPPLDHPELRQYAQQRKEAAGLGLALPISSSKSSALSTSTTVRG